MKGQIFILGRDSSKVNIEIDHDTISAIHAQIVLLNGELLVVGEFNKGLKNGYWTYYNTEGRLLSDLTYKQGDTATTVKFYSENGQVETEIIPIAIKLKQEKSQAKKDKRAEKKAACKAKECKWFPKRLKKDTSAVIAPVDSLLKK